MCESYFLENPIALKFIPDYLKTKNMCKKALDISPNRRHIKRRYAKI